MPSLPALTLWQPWATLIAIGVKPDETRARHAPAHLLGQRIAIHAAARKPTAMDFSKEIDHAIAAHAEALRKMRDATRGVIWHGLLPLGAVVCTAILTDCVDAEDVEPNPFGNHDAGRFSWRLRDVRPLALPVPAKGEQRYGWMWEMPESVVL